MVDHRLTDALRTAARGMRTRLDRLGRGDSESRLANDAETFWRDADDPRWHDDSHWREDFRGDWASIGRSSLDISERLMRVTGAALPAGRTVEWGAGGGANAVVFAPFSTEFVAVDVAKDSLEECERQVSQVCDTPVRKVLIDVAEPESAVDRVGRGSCDLFVCFYVMELVPSQRYGARIVEAAHSLLRDGGVAVIQVKYTTTSSLSRSRRRAYGRDPANMTTYPIDEFWTLAQRVGFRAWAVELVPQNDLDERYAYYLLTKGTD